MPCHCIRIVVANEGIDTDADRHGTFAAGSDRYRCCAIASAITMRPAIGAHHRASHDFVVIGADGGFFRRNGRMGQQRKRRCLGIDRIAGTGSATSGLLVGSQVVTGTTVVQERAVEIHDGFATLANNESTITGEGSDDRRVDAPPGGQCKNGSRISSGEHHAFLCFAQPGFPAGQTLIFAGHRVEIDVGPKHTGHLTDRRTQAASTAVSDRGVQASIASGHDNIDQALLDDGVADLHRTASNIGSLSLHGLRREGGTADAIASDGTTKYDDRITRLRIRGMRADGQYAHASGEHQWRRRIGRVIDHGATDVWNADLVAVVADTGNDPIPDTAWVQHAIG